VASEAPLERKYSRWWQLGGQFFQIKLDNEVAGQLTNLNKQIK